jgi:O-antigen ligase
MGAVVVMIWAFPRQRWTGTILLVGGAAFVLMLWSAGLLPVSVTARLTGFGEDFSGIGDARGVVISDENFAVIERLAHWQSALEMAKTSPWLGIGFNNYEAAYPNFALINWQFALGHAHNYYLNLLAETGIVGLTAYLVMWMAVFYHNWRLLAQIQHWQQRGLAVGLLGVWTHIAIHSLIDKLYVNNLFLHVGVMLGLLAMLTFREKNAHDGNSFESA